nr:RNA polymerase beta subunit protein a [Chloromonas rosae]
MACHKNHFIKQSLKVNFSYTKRAFTAKKISWLAEVRVAWRLCNKSAINAIFKTTNSSLLLSDFVDIQRKSFCELLEKGLIEEFSKRNPITNKNLEIFFYPEYYQLTPPEYNPRRAILYSKSYSAKLFVPAQLTDKKLQKSQLKWVLIGNLPLMTKRGHFILNGAPRVIVNQILRSPGIYFQGSLKQIFSEKWSEKPEITYKRFYTDLICLRGTWLRIEIDKNKDIWAQMKKIPKIPILWFLLAMGLTERIILKSVINPTRLLATFNLEIKRKIPYEYVTNASDAWKEISNLISSSGTPSKQNTVNSSMHSIPQKALWQAIQPKQKNTSSAWETPTEPLVGPFGAQKIAPTKQSEKQGKVASNISLTKGKQSTKTKKKIILNTKKNGFVPNQNQTQKGASVPNNVLLLSPASRLGSVGYKTNRRARQSFGSFLTFSEQSKEGRNWIFKRFMNPRTYDLGKQGRLNFNRKLGLTISSNQTTLTAQDVLYATDYLLKLEKGLKKIDDIDHLKNRRVRTSGELLQIQIGIGLIRLEKIIRNNLALKINAQTIKTVGPKILPNSPSSLLNKVKPLMQTKLEDFRNNLNDKNLNGAKYDSISPIPAPRFFRTLALGTKQLTKQETNSKKGGTGGAIKSFASFTEPEDLKLTNLINTKAVNGALREFFGSCLTPDHNVLTDKGFIPIQEVTLEHKVATLKNNEELVYEHPTKVHKYDYDGQMYEVKVPGLSLKTTLNHRMFVQLKTDTRIKVRPYALIPASDLLNKKVCYKKDALWTAPDYQFILPGIPSQSPKEYSDWLKGLGNSANTHQVIGKIHPKAKFALPILKGLAPQPFLKLNPVSAAEVLRAATLTRKVQRGAPSTLEANKVEHNQAELNLAELNQTQLESHAIPEKIMPMNAWLVFMGFFITEAAQRNPFALSSINNEPKQGGAENPNAKIEYKVILSLKKTIQCTMIEKTLNELNIYYYKKPNDSGCFDYFICDKQLWAYLRNYRPGAIKTILPEWVWKLSRRQCNILLNALIASDACRAYKGSYVLHSCYHSNSLKLINKALLNVVGRLILHAGYAAFTFLKSPLRPNYTILKSKRLVLTTNPSWSVNGLLDRYSPIVNQKDKGLPSDDKLVYYKGPVYCLTVPNEVFYVEREGKTVWTGNSQLSQFMDQLNPLAEITHKRRLSSMGPGGVTRDSATLAIRGIHPTHYGRICPIETPEGKNTGLVNSLTTYARANSQGFLESPFYKVYKGQIQKTAGIYFLSAEQEENIKVAAADVSSLAGRIGFLPKSKIPAKIGYGDTISKISRNRVEYIGVSPIQMISIATSLIPFLEHDDANRALMGSNMQRQAVPLIRAERPLVGTGLESRTVSDSGHSVIAKESGYVAYVSAKKIVIYTIL